MQIPPGKLCPTGTFQGVNPRATQPLGQVTLPVTFGTPANFRTESITFDVVDIPLPYNGILGCPALAKFMAASHRAYNALNIPGPWGIITIKINRKDAIFCVKK